MSHPDPGPGAIVTYEGERYEVAKVTPGDRRGNVVRAERPGGTIVFPESELEPDGEVWLIA